MSGASFIGFDEVRRFFHGKSVAIVGSGPSVLSAAEGFIDSHDIVVRVNNHKLGPAQGFRTDVHYSFYGTSIRKNVGDLVAEGVRLCMCKLPNSKPLDSEWHERNNKPEGVDYRYIYRNRARWWFCPTFVPDDARFLSKFELLGKHQPTTGFAAILDILECDIKSAFLVGFDGFSSGIHNVDEKWKPGRADDPIGHRPERELEWLARNEGSYPITADPDLAKRLEGWRQIAA